MKNTFTIEDCITINDAGYDIYINDGLVTTNYTEEKDDEFVVPIN